MAPGRARGSRKQAKPVKRKRKIGFFCFIHLFFWNQDFSKGYEQFKQYFSGAQGPRGRPLLCSSYDLTRLRPPLKGSRRF